MIMRPQVFLVFLLVLIYKTTNATLQLNDDIGNEIKAFIFADHAFRNIKHKRAVLKLIGGATEVGRKLVKVLTASAKEIPNPYMSKHVRQYEKLGDRGTLIKDLSKFENDPALVYRKEGMEAIRVGDRIMLATPRGVRGNPTLTIVKQSDLEKVMRNEQNVLPRDIITYTSYD